MANVGDHDGRFLTTLGVKQGSLGVPEMSVEVPAGETLTHTVTIDPHYYEGVEAFDVVLDWGAGHREATVPVARTKTGTETATARPTG